MSCYLIVYEDRVKKLHPVYSPQEYVKVRNSEQQKALVARARSGEGEAKRRLAQFNYSCIPGDDGNLRGCKSASNSVGMDIDFHPDDPEYETKMGSVPQLVLSHKDELGLLMLERSATKGYHLVFKRQAGLTQEENLQWASKLLGVKYDEGAKDITRVFFATTASAEDLLFLDEELFDNEPTDPLTPLRGDKNGDEGKDSDVSSLPLKGKSRRTECPPRVCVKGGGLVGKDSDVSTLPLKGERGGGLVSKDSNVSTLPLKGERGGGLEGLEGLPFDIIVPTLCKLIEPTFPNVAEGLRNNTLFELAADVRYICEFNEAKLKAVLYPKYTFGLPESEVDSTLRSALMRERYRMPKRLREILTTLSAHSGTSPIEGEGGMEYSGLSPYNSNYSLPNEVIGRAGGGSSPYPSVSQCIVEEMSLPKMPKWVEKLLIPVLPGYKFITICGASTAMMTLLSDVTKKFGTKPEARLNGWTHWDGLSGSGKRQLHDVIEELIKPLRAQDAKTRELLNGIIEYNKTAKEGEKKVLPPLGIRVLECDTTRKAHITQMDNLKGKKTFTFAEEISSLNLNRAGYYYRGDFCRLNFDNGLVGYLNATGDSASVVTPCNWDVTTSGTHDQTLKQWQNAISDGSAQRVLICLVPDNTYQPLPTYKQYSEEDMAYIARATSLMLKLQGLVLTPKLDNALNAWVESVRQEMKILPEAERNDERARFRFRSNEIAHTLGVVIHCCHIVQEILDAEDSLSEELKVKSEELEKVRSDISSSCDQIAEAERAVIAAREALETWKSTALDMSQYGEHKSTIDLALYAADYCLDTQDLLWTKRLRAQQRASYEGINVSQSTRSRSEDDYLSLPERFKMSDLNKYLPTKSKSACKQLIFRFIKSNMLVKVGTEGGFAVYEKTA